MQFFQNWSTARQKFLHEYLQKRIMSYVSKGYVIRVRNDHFIRQFMLRNGPNLFIQGARKNAELHNLYASIECDTLLDAEWSKDLEKFIFFPYRPFVTMATTATLTA